MIELVYYDESSPTGLRWAVDRSRGVRAGDFAGSLGADGYWRVSLMGKYYKAHRVVMALHGKMELSSKMVIDHINRNKRDNRLDNLRVVTQHQNSLNLPEYSTNTTGCKGVYKVPSGKWQASIRINKSTKHLGIFDTIFDAACARKSAEASHYLI